MLQLFVGPYSVKHVDNKLGDAVKLSVQFIFDEGENNSNSSEQESSNDENVTHAQLNQNN